MNLIRDAVLDWEGDLRFRGSAPGKPAILMDGNAVAGPSPVVTLLLAGASCAASDVVLILEKMRTPLESLRVLAHGVRREKEPRRFEKIHYVFEMKGAGVDRTKAERAVSLSVEKYCSVLASLAPDIVVTHEIRIL
ncbi:MAG TPA: OsmC family protein [Gemmatimonadales bacterium]|jgi:putative redox protein|nr:OsmC family protein [Gemmatimonadales bacterium]